MKDGVFGFSRIISIISADVGMTRRGFLKLVTCKYCLVRLYALGGVDVILVVDVDL